MTAQDRLADLLPDVQLGQIEDRYVEWRQDRGNHTPAPDTGTWADAGHPDESMEHCIVRNDVPALVAALRAVLDVCNESTVEARPYRGGKPYMIVPVREVYAAIAAALGEEQ